MGFNAAQYVLEENLVIEGVAFMRVDADKESAKTSAGMMLDSLKNKVTGGSS